jgi:1-aminocyclopropane-1-carboxylate deaminase/D-cysteine desulfhydrase-like pyridoxal-dependent ACC family enzyme
VRQTAAVAAKLGLHCVALLENPIGTRAENYLTNGNRLLLDLFNTQVEMCDALTDPAAQLDELATRIEAQGYRPYVIPVGGSNALGRWAMWKARWKSPSSAKARWRSRRWWSPPAAPAPMPGWRWAWNS